MFCAFHLLFFVSGLSRLYSAFMFLYYFVLWFFKRFCWRWTRSCWPRPLVIWTVYIYLQMSDWLGPELKMKCVSFWFMDDRMLTVHTRMRHARTHREWTEWWGHSVALSNHQQPDLCLGNVGIYCLIRSLEGWNHVRGCMDLYFSSFFIFLGKKTIKVDSFWRNSLNIIFYLVLRTSLLFLLLNYG